MGRNVARSRRRGHLFRLLPQHPESVARAAVGRRWPERTRARSEAGHRSGPGCAPRSGARARWWLWGHRPGRPFLAARAALPGGGPVAPHVFEYLFHRNEPRAAWLAAAIVLVAAAGRALEPDPGAPPRLPSGRGPPGVHRRRGGRSRASGVPRLPRAPALDGRVRAALPGQGSSLRGHLAAKVPPLLLPRLVSAHSAGSSRWRRRARSSPLTGPDLRCCSPRSPGSAFPGYSIRLIGALSLALLWRLARRLWPGRTRPAGGPLRGRLAGVLGQRHLLLFDGRAPGRVARVCPARSRGPAGPCRRGRLAGLALHIRFPHLLFALPFVAWLLMRGRPQSATLLRWARVLHPGRRRGMSKPGAYPSRRAGSRCGQRLAAAESPGDERSAKTAGAGKRIVQGEGQRATTAPAKDQPALENEQGNPKRRARCAPIE